MECVDVNRKHVDVTLIAEHTHVHVFSMKHIVLVIMIVYVTINARVILIARVILFVIVSLLTVLAKHLINKGE